MSQTFHTLFETNRMLDDVARHNDNYAALKSSFSGTSFPPSPTTGQTCWRIDKGTQTATGFTGKLYKFSGDTSLGLAGWVTDEETSSVTKEVINSRGSKLTLDQRLDISLNEDGTLKATASQYSSEWSLSAVTFTYIDSKTFKTSGNTTDIFLPTRKVKVNVTGSYSLSEVVSSSYNSTADTTTVNVKDAIVTTSLVSVNHGIISPNGSLSYYTKEVLDERHQYITMKVKLLENVIAGDLLEVTSYGSYPEVSKYSGGNVVGICTVSSSTGDITDIITRGVVSVTVVGNVGDEVFSDGVSSATTTRPTVAYQSLGFILGSNSLLFSPSEVKTEFRKAEKAQDVNTGTTYKDSVTGKLYKMYIENTKLLIEEL